MPPGDLEELASDVGAGGDAAPASAGMPAAPAATGPPAIFGHLPAGHAAAGDARGTVIVDLSASPTSLAQSADLEADTRPAAEPGPGYVGTSPELYPYPFYQAPVRDTAGPVAATPGVPVTNVENVPAPPGQTALVSGSTVESFLVVAPAETGAMPSQILSPSATP